jgi:hypothetical protein
VNGRSARDVGKAFLGAILVLLAIVPALLIALIRFLIWLIGTILRREKESPPRQDPCLQVPPHIRRRPDPCLYSQTYIMKYFPGIPVTWINPDIWLTTEDGNPVDVHALQPATRYVVHGRIHDASFDPSLGTQVRCWYRSYGFSAPVDVPVPTQFDGTDFVAALDIAPWGSDVARFGLTTPHEPGHYCVVVACSHPSDANAENNVGQTNTDVVGIAAGSSMHLDIPIAARDAADGVRVDVDAYRIPAGEITLRLKKIVVPLDGGRVDLLALTSRRTVVADERRFAGKGPVYVGYAYKGRDEVIAANQEAPRALPPGWLVEVEAVADGAAVVPVRISVPNDAPHGTTSLNLTARTRLGDAIGGVTIAVAVGG